MTKDQNMDKISDKISEDLYTYTNISI